MLHSNIIAFVHHAFLFTVGSYNDSGNCTITLYCQIIKGKQYILYIKKEKKKYSNGKVLNEAISLVWTRKKNIIL